MRKAWSGSIFILTPEGPLTAPLNYETNLCYCELDALRRAPRPLILDLTHVPRLNHVGMNELSTLLSAYQSQGQQIVLTEPNLLANNPFALGFLMRNFSVRPTIEAALELFKSSPTAIVK
jgi:anti-anti-sigma regulatory factor